MSDSRDVEARARRGAVEKAGEIGAVGGGDRESDRRAADGEDSTWDRFVVAGAENRGGVGKCGGERRRRARSDEGAAVHQGGGLRRDSRHRSGTKHSNHRQRRRVDVVRCARSNGALWSGCDDGRSRGVDQAVDIQRVSRAQVLESNRGTARGGVLHAA